jgi:hypothetical protein
VTNISDPQIQGSPSTVVVEPQDSGDYIFPDYSGNICFTSSDADAVIPDCYYFDAAVDHGIHSFGNGVAFLSTGEKWVRVSSTVGNYTGVQQNITVNLNGAGPLAKIKFLNLPAQPIQLGKNKSSGPFTIGLFDSNDQAVNASVGGYPVRVSATSSSGLFSLAANGPWTSALPASIPAGLSSLNFYYKDGTAGSYTITGSDWQNGRDDIAVSDDAFNIAVSGLTILATTKFESRDSAKFALVANPSLFSNDGNTPLSEGSATFNLTAKDDLTAAITPVTWNFVFKDVHGNAKDTQNQTSGGTYNLVESPIEYDIPADSGDWSLDATATAADGRTGIIHIPVPVSYWRADIEYDVGYIQLGAKVPIKVISFENNGVVQAPADFTVLWLDTTSNVIVGPPALTKSQMTENPPGNFHGYMSTDGLTAGRQYHMMLIGKDSNGNILAESAHADIQIANNTALAPKNLSIEKIATSSPSQPEAYDLKLSWDQSASNNVTNYNVYYTENKFSTLYDDPCSITQVQNGDRAAGNCEKTIHMDVGTDSANQWVLSTTTSKNTLSYTIHDAQNLPGNDHFFVVRADNGVAESGLSSMVFSNKLPFNYYGANVSNVNWLSVPFIPQYYTNLAAALLKSVFGNASVAVKDIEGGTGTSTNQKIKRVSLWDPVTQGVGSSYIYRAGGVFNKWTGVDFGVAPGSGVYLETSGGIPAFNWTTVGHDAETPLAFRYIGSDTTNVYWVSLPYSGMYKKASDIVSDIEGGTGANSNQKIKRVSLWDPVTQGVGSSYIYRAGGAFNKWTGVNFDVAPGSGVYIELSGATNAFTWTPALLVDPNQ